MTYLNRTKITDDTGTVINPASDDTVMLLRRIVKLLESNAVVDVQNRQRVTIDSVPTSITTLGISLGNVNTPTTVAPITNTSAYYQPVWEGPVDQRFRVMEDAHTAYQLGIRSHLSFT